MPHKITALTAQKRNPQRVNVYLDGEFAFGLARIVAAWLQVGQELTDEVIARLQWEDAREQAYQRAIRYIGYRPRTAEEIRRYLRRHEVAEEHITTVLDRLREMQLVDDVAFARAWVEDRIAFHPRGRRAMQAEMRKKGLPEAVIAQALEQVDETSLAFRAACKAARRYRRLDWAAFRQKLSAHLARRGFPYDIVKEVVASVWQQYHPDSPSASAAGVPLDNEEMPCMD